MEASLTHLRTITSMGIALALLAAVCTQGPLPAEGHAWLSIRIAEVSATDPGVHAQSPYTPELSWDVWRPLGFDERGPYGRLERFDVREVRQDRGLHLEVARDEYVDLVAYGPGHGVAELRVAPETARRGRGRPGPRTVELVLPLAGDERGRVELDLTPDDTVPWFDPTWYRLWELAPTGALWIREAGSGHPQDSADLGHSVLMLSAGRHRLAVGARAWRCGSGPLIPDMTVVPRVTLDVAPGSTTRWSPILTRGTSFELRVECPGIALPPMPDHADLEGRLPWGAPIEDRELERWIAARFIARATGEICEPRWGWDLQPYSDECGVFPLGVDAFTIQRLPPGVYSLEVRGPGIAPLTLDVTLEAPEMEPLTLVAERR